jgi:hypothetical protein
VRRRDASHRQRLWSGQQVDELADVRLGQGDPVAAQRQTGMLRVGVELACVSGEP